MDCIAWSVTPIEPWAMPLATQNKITRSYALSFVVALAMMGDFHGQALRNAAIAALRRRLYRAGVSHALVRVARFRWS
jgi:hypothetical protein